jgi:hypothetical protein
VTRGYHLGVPYTQEIFVKDFAAALHEEVAAVFVGAGLSQGAGYPGWESFVSELATRLGLPLSGDLLTLAQFVVNRDRGRAQLNRRIVEEFTRPRHWTDIHKELAMLPLKTFWTTNYDALLENALQEFRGRPEVKKTQADLARHIPDRSATVFKMHGDAEAPQEAVLVRDDYEDYARVKELFVDVLTADLLTKTFVFMGVSFTDPNLMFLLGRLRSIYEGARKEHFWIAKRPAGADALKDLFDLRVDDLQRYGIHTVLVNDYAELATLMHRVHQEYAHIRRRNTIFFSGSVRDSNPRAQDIRGFAQVLGEGMVLKGRTLITGLGRGIGSFITSAALDALYRKSEFAIRSDQVVARPFPVGSANDPNARRTHRIRMISEAGFSIFIAGRGDDPSGTKEEYLIARQLGSIVLPIGATGSDAADLWNQAMLALDEIFGSRRTDVEELFKTLNDTNVALRCHVQTLNTIVDKLQN